jgi:hypothetical protein
MRIALARGDAATALDQYDVCRRVLRAELGVEPAAATAALARGGARARWPRGRSWPSTACGAHAGVGAGAAGSAGGATLELP